MDVLISRYCHLKPGKRPVLKEWPTRIPSDDLGDKHAAHKELAEIGQELASLQRRLWAEKRHKVLIVLQGMDTSGKDGTIRHVFRFTNPQGVNVAPFEKPTTRELSYDYLWRVHQQVPHTGEMAIFDRSHYEDIVAVRVNNLRPENVWKKRYKHLNAFEEMLADEGVTILKFLLHISLEEQKKRLQARLENEHKYWKFDESDLVARERWPAYMEAYEDVLERCNAPCAPWFIIPADKKWQRNLLVARIVRDTLAGLKMEYPKAHFDPATIQL